MIINAICTFLSSTYISLRQFFDSINNWLIKLLSRVYFTAFRLCLRINTKILEIIIAEAKDFTKFNVLFVIVCCICDCSKFNKLKRLFWADLFTVCVNIDVSVFNNVKANVNSLLEFGIISSLILLKSTLFWSLIANLSFLSSI